MIRLIPDTNIDFIGKRYYAIVLSGVLVLLGIFAMVQIFAFGRANMGIEFTGGTSIVLEFEKPVRIDDARAVLARGGFPNARLQDIRGTTKLSIRVKGGVGAADAVEGVARQIIEIFQKEFADNAARLESSEFIGPVIGQELRQKAVRAILFATLGLLVYIALRFDFKFGVAAAIATLHDVLAVLGIVYLLNTEITLLIMVALLTIAGYSLTDTVVVFDRIRENLPKHRREPLVQIINASINQVLNRTLVTSLTTLLAVLALYVLGGDVLRDFSFSLLIGVIIGTYSSIFVASPLLVMWRGGRSKLLGQAKK